MSSSSTAATPFSGGEMLPTVVTVEKGGGGPAFFGIATADAFIYAELSKALGKGQAFYGLHPQGIVDVKKPEVDVRALAARYVAEMKRIQPEGPYHMGGMCAGGFVAYEAGKLLMEEGREVGVVALFDAPGPVWMWYRFFLLRRWMGRSVEHMYQHMRTLCGLGWRERWEYVKMRSGRLARKLKGERVGSLKKRKDVPVDRAYWMVFNGAYMYAAANYRPEKYPGKLVLFHAENAGTWRYSGSRVKWGKLAAGGVEIETVPGAHSEILHAPNVAVMAEKLARHMRGGDWG